MFSRFFETPSAASRRTRARCASSSRTTSSCVQRRGPGSSAMAPSSAGHRPWVQAKRHRRRRGRDSNPRTGSRPSTVFKTAAFNRSATPPSDGFQATGTRVAGPTRLHCAPAERAARPIPRRGGRVAEGTRLLSEYGAASSIAGSNPALSALNATATLSARFTAPVAQLDRASVYGTEGQRFESSRARLPGPLLRRGFRRSRVSVDCASGRAVRRPISSRLLGRLSRWCSDADPASCWGHPLREAWVVGVCRHR